MALLVTNQHFAMAEEIKEIESYVNLIDARPHNGTVKFPIRQEGQYNEHAKKLYDEKAVLHVVSECNELGFFCYYYRPTISVQAPTHIIISRRPDNTNLTKRIMS